MGEQPKLDRARRNLVIATTILFFYLTTGAKFGQVGIPPVQLTFSDPERVVWWMWALLAYFLVRYGQFFNTSIQSKEREIVDEFARPRAQRWAYDKLLQMVREKHPDINDPNMTLTFHANDKRRDKWVYSASSAQFKNQSGEGTSRGWGESSPVVTVENEQLRDFRAVALREVSWRREYFTENFLPVVFPFLPILWTLIVSLNRLLS